MSNENLCEISKKLMKKWARRKESVGYIAYIIQNSTGISFKIETKEWIFERSLTTKASISRIEKKKIIFELAGAL